MPALASLYEPIAEELRQVCELFDDELFSELPIVNELCGQVRQYRGKMLRPALLLLSGKACGRLTSEHLTLAAVVEMVHMATLVHDDVLDEADLRRRSPTINRLQGNEAAILLGDYLISHAFHLCSGLDSQRASRIIGATTNTVCEGELQQIRHRGDYELSVEQYLQIITRKTAALTGACCRLGAEWARAEPAAATALERYGLDVGIAFQITDDVLDIVGSEQRMGKTLGRDLDKQKLTLPIIHGLRNSPSAVARQLRALAAAPANHRPELRELLENNGSIQYALETAGQYVTSAVDGLSTLRESESRHLLQRMAGMILDRQQ